MTLMRTQSSHTVKDAREVQSQVKEQVEHARNAHRG